MTNTATVIVFGATGFIGGWITRVLSSEGWRCISIDRYGRTHDTLNNLNTVEEPYYIGGSWAEDKLARFLAKIGTAVVINAAGAAWATDAPTVFRDNIDWPRRLGIACVLSQSVREIVHIGSAHEYGQLPQGSAIREIDSLKPDSTYARSKSIGTSYLVRAAYETNVPIRIIRPFNVIGPRYGSQGLWSMTINLYRNALEKGYNKIVASIPEPEVVRDFIDVRDVAKLVLLSLGRPNLPLVSIYNAGSGQARSIRELYEVLREVTGIDYEFSSIVKNLRPGSKWQCASIQKSESELGWWRDFSLKDSIRDSLVSFLDK
ncbi:NAD-dependent epimerase/dehydratase family protein [Photorhabdus temperata]|uniref:NAD-dependent epimerase/dehydratase domain-containing protein n=1 Tax=Photorhabdus temperata J3 TaxID=1389415 RepID=U7R252_PHOTE|nr:NAD(P)-dependent oxidoreductase [Photorhabdus temperata]ERT13680.1 hypothetical protein O185_07565 [Photorhabdus temperata J3]